MIAKGVTSWRYIMYWLLVITGDSKIDLKIGGSTDTKQVWLVLTVTHTVPMAGASSQKYGRGAWPLHCNEIAKESGMVAEGDRGHL